MVQILLASYNGEKYIREQLDSLLGQNYPDIQILVRDDSSTDRTPEILEEYQEANPGRITLIRDALPGGSAAANFFALLSHASADYIMFCDQDDVWFPQKVGRTLEVMRNEEKTSRPKEPILVFSEYVVADAELRPMNIRENQLQIAKFYVTLPRLLVQNYVTGCTCMLNREAYSHLGTAEPGIPMHDWWAALYASAFGHIVHLPEKLMLYRQHGDNQVAAKNVKSFRYRLDRLKDPQTRTSMQRNYRQAEIFRQRYGGSMPESKRKVLDGFLELRDLPKPERVRKLIQGGYLKGDFVRAAAEILFL